MAEKVHQHPNSVTVEKCIIRKFDNSAQVCYEEPITNDMIISFDFMESITSPFVSGQLLLSDSADFINTFPIEGGEQILMSINHSFDKDARDYDLRVYKIGGRTIDGKLQTYSLMLVSEEAIVNESVRVQEPLDGNSESLTIKLLREKLNSSKRVMSEPSRFKVRMIPGSMRPFDIIARLIRRSVSSQTSYGQSRETSDITSTEQQIKGSAGFFFWETFRGYNFFSIDALCDTSEEQTFIFKDKQDGKKESKPRLETEAWGPYEEAIANTEEGKDARFILTTFTFQSEVDIMTSLRMGKYSTKMIFFNHSTGQYDEYVYKIRDSYNNMAHLGGQSQPNFVPGNTDDLSDKPTRIMSAVLDPETWYDDPKVGDPDVKDVKNPTEYADWTKYYAAQSVARVDLLRNQESVMKIPPNPLICAGDKVTVLLQNKTSDADKVKKPYDLESSGVYLVRQVTHTFNFVNSGTGTGFTTLRLFRDSYGTDIEPSNRGKVKENK